MSEGTITVKDSGNKKKNPPARVAGAFNVPAKPGGKKKSWWNGHVSTPRKKDTEE